jgi:hypothetical protein
MQVKRFNHHSAPVRHLSFDTDAEFIASCCGDAYVTVGAGGGWRRLRGSGEADQQLIGYSCVCK